MQDMDFRGRWVLVTGASSGLGYWMAKLFALELGANVIPVARRAERLEALRREILASVPGAQVEPIVADLANLEDVDRVYREATAKGPLYAAVLNAGVTHFGEYHELSWSDFQTMLATNVTGVVRLTTLLLPDLERRADGSGLLIVSSLAGLLPVPYQTAYSATKAFLISFGCGLWHETQGRNVSITTFVPGGIKTEMTAGERFRALSGWLMSPEQCARDGIRAFAKRRYLHVPGALMRAGTALLNLVPRRFVTSRLAATYRNALHVAAAKRVAEAPAHTHSASPE
jgi:short-subunit dehydrogenase